MKVNLYKKGTCLITIEKYVIVNRCNEFGEEEMMTETNTILKIAKFLGV